MDILKIIPESRKDSLIWEHIIKSLFAAVGFIVLLIFGPMFMTTNRHQPGKVNKQDLNFILDLYQENPWIFVVGPILGLLAFNLLTILKNLEKEHIIGIQIDKNSNETVIELISLYSNKSVFKKTTETSLIFEMKKEESFFQGKREILKLLSSNGRLLGLIILGNGIYGKQKVLVEKAIEQINSTEPNKA